MYDIAIIGAGPAGATLARLLGRNYRTLLVDRRQLDRPASGDSLAKLCGGLLAPAAQAELARQGLGVPASVIAGPQLFAVRTLDIQAQLERLYQRFYINVDREAFDRWLVGLVPSGVERVFGWSLTSLDTDPAGSFLRFRTAEDGDAGVRAKLVVGADGASSLVRRLAFPHARHPSSYVAVQASFELSSADPFYGAVFDADLTDFYGWTVPKRGDLLAGIAVPGGQGAAATFDEFVNRLRTGGFRFGAELSRASAAISRPTNILQLCPGNGGVLLAGEAAGFISPSSAEGISYALSSAALLARSLQPGLSGAAQRYRAAVAPLAFKVGIKGAKSAAIYASTSRRLAMRSGIGAIATGGTVAAPQLSVR
jgi:geranylgeranyl reductase